MRVRRRASELATSILVATLVIAVAASVANDPAGAQTGPRQNLEGTWVSQEGQRWIVVGERDQGNYSAVYSGTGAHSKLSGQVQGFFDGTTWSGSIHAEEPNQVEGGPPTIADFTFSFRFQRDETATLDGDIVGPTGTYATTLTCQRGPCTEAPCQFVKSAVDRKLTEDEVAVNEDLEFFLETRFPDSTDCSITIKQVGGPVDISVALGRGRAGKLLGELDDGLASEFPETSAEVRAKVARAVAEAVMLNRLQTKDEFAFPGLRDLVDSGALSRLAGVALTPPGNSQAADAMIDIVRLVALNDAGAGEV